jgi:hypothetical protein
MNGAVSVTELILFVLIVTLALPYLVWRIGRTDHWAPLVEVEIVTGILLGSKVKRAVRQRVRIKYHDDK